MTDKLSHKRVMFVYMYVCLCSMCVCVENVQGVYNWKGIVRPMPVKEKIEMHCIVKCHCETQRCYARKCNNI